MKNFNLFILTLVLSVGLIIGCAEEKQPAGKTKESTNQPVVSAVEKPVLMKEAAPVTVTDTAEKVVEKVAEASGADVDKEALKDLVTSEADIKAGSLIFMSKCMACHGADGKGTAMAPAFKGNEWIKGTENSEIADVIKNGRQGSAKKYKQFPIAMPAQKIDDKEVSALISYLKSLAFK